jgi:hypothetical protein
MDLTATGIAAFVGVIIAFGLETIPALKTAWDKVSDSWKRPILLGLFLVAPFAILGLSCTGAQFVTAPCPAGAFTTLPFYYSNLWLGITAFAGSQFGFTNGAKSLDTPKNP